MDVYTFDTEQLENMMTQSKNTFLSYLLTQGYINFEQYEHLVMNTAIIARKVSFFSKLWDKYLKGDEKTNTYLMVVEQKTFFKDDKTPEDGEKKGKVYHLKEVKKDEKKSE